MKDRVIFRKWNIRLWDKDVIAFLPDNEANPGRVDSYEHIGQHGEADYLGLLSRTKPATKDEYQDLYDELTSIGYDLKVMRRLTRH